MSSDEIAERIGRRAVETGVTIAVAESLTGGLVVQALARTEGSGEWLQGGVVAYASDVKHGLLDVTADAVVSERSVLEMAASVRRLLGAGVSVGVTGVGGPGRQDGLPPGTVWIAVDDGRGRRASCHEFDGDPSEICRAAVDAALAALDEVLAERRDAQAGNQRA